MHRQFSTGDERRNQYQGYIPPPPTMEDPLTEGYPIGRLDDHPQPPLDLPNQPLQCGPGMPGRTLWGKNCPTNAPRTPRFDPTPTMLLPTGQRSKPPTQKPQMLVLLSSTMPHPSFIRSTTQTKHCWLACTCTPKPTASSFHGSRRYCKDTTQPNCHAVDITNGDTSDTLQHP